MRKLFLVAAVFALSACDVQASIDNIQAGVEQDIQNQIIDASDDIRNAAEDRVQHELNQIAPEEESNEANAQGQ